MCVYVHIYIYEILANAKNKQCNDQKEVILSLLDDMFAYIEKLKQPKLSKLKREFSKVAG